MTLLSIEVRLTQGMAMLGFVCGSGWGGIALPLSSQAVYKNDGNKNNRTHKRIYMDNAYQIQ